MIVFKLLYGLFDFIFYANVNKTLYKDDFRYVMYRKLGSVLLSTFALYSVLSQFEISTNQLIAFTISGFLVFTVIVYHSLTSAMRNNDKKTYYIIMFFVVIGWVLNGYYFVIAEISKNSKELIVYDDAKYLNFKNKLDDKLNKEIALVNSELNDLISNRDKTIEDMFNLRKSNKRAYYSMYIKPIKDDISIPSIKRDANDTAIKQVLSYIVDEKIKLAKNKNSDKINEIIANFKNSHIEDYNYLNSISKTEIDKRNKEIELENKALNDGKYQDKIIYSLGFFLLGFFVEMVVFGNSWVEYKEDKDYNFNKQIEDLRVINGIINNGYHAFIKEFKIKDNARTATIYAFVQYLLEINKNIDIKSRYHFRIKDLVIITNKNTNKPYIIKGYIRETKDLFVKNNLNFSNLSKTRLKILLESY
jgi:hypothetical protein